jgi:hypothetical protein
MITIFTQATPQDIERIQVADETLRWPEPSPTYHLAVGDEINVVTHSGVGPAFVGYVADIDDEGTALVSFS